MANFVCCHQETTSSGSGLCAAPAHTLDDYLDLGRQGPLHAVPLSPQNPLSLSENPELKASIADLYGLPEYIWLFETS